MGLWEFSGTLAKVLRSLERDVDCIIYIVILHIMCEEGGCSVLEGCVFLSFFFSVVVCFEWSRVMDIRLSLRWET